MEFKFTLTKNMMEKLTLMSKIISANKADAFPRAVLVSKSAIHAANPIISVSYKMGTEELGLMPELFDEPVCLSLKALKLILAEDEGAEVTITSEDKTLKIKAGKRRAVATVNEISSSLYPKIDAISPECMHKVSSEFFIDALKRTAYAAANASKMKPVYTCTQVEGKVNEGITIFTIDGMKASIIKNSSIKVEKDFTISIPPECVNILSTCKCDDDIQLGVTADSRKAVVLVDSQTLLRTALIAGEVIDYTKYITEKKYSLKLSKAAMMSVLKRISLISVEEPMVCLTVNSDKVLMEYKEKTNSYAGEIDTTENNVDEEFKIGANYSFLLESLKSCPSDVVTFNLGSPLEPMYVKDVNTLALIVPMRMGK